MNESFYCRQTRTIHFPIDSITGEAYKRIREECFGKTIGRNLVIPEVFWHEANHTLERKNYSPAAGYVGIRQLQQVGGLTPGWDWESKRPHLKDMKLPGKLGTDTPTKLRSYQCPAVSALADGDLLLADDMGLGKTLSILTARREVLKERGLGWRMIVLVPQAEIADEWVQMAWEHWQEVAVHIKDRSLLTGHQRGFINGVGIWIITYSKIWRDGYLQLLQQELQTNQVILAADEAHQGSGANSKQFQALYALRRNAALFWAMTGTEVTNLPDSYWAMYSLVTNCNLNFEDWLGYFSRGLTEPDGRRPLWDMDRLKSVAQTRGNYALRRLKTEVADLPPLIGPITHLVPMAGEHRQCYKQLWNDSKYIFETDIGQLTDYTIDQFFAKHIRLYQVATWPGLIKELTPHADKLEPTPKLERLFSLILEAGDQKTLIWCSFPDAIEWLASKLRAKFPWKRGVTAHGRLEQDERNIIKREAKEGAYDWVIANPAIWGQGVNLTAFSVNIYWDLHPNRVRWQQSQGRSWRDGAKQAVSIHLLLHSDSVEVMTLNWLRKKDLYANALVTGQGDLSTLERVATHNPKLKIK